VTSVEQATRERSLFSCGRAGVAMEIDEELLRRLLMAGQGASRPSHELPRASPVSRVPVVRLQASTSLVADREVAPWRMNITCCSAGWLWVALDDYLVRLRLSELAPGCEGTQSAVESMKHRNTDLVNQICAGTMGLLDMVVAVCDDGSVTVWDAHGPADQIPVTLSNQGPTWSLSLASCLGEEFFMVHRSAHEQEIARLDACGHARLHKRARALLALGSNSYDVTLFDMQSSRTGPTVFRDCQHNVPSVALNCDGSKLAAASIDGHIRIWDVASGVVTARASADGEWMWHVQWLPSNSIRVVPGWESPAGQCVACAPEIQWEASTGASMVMHSQEFTFPFATAGVTGLTDTSSIVLEQLVQSDSDDSWDNSSDEEQVPVSSTSAQGDRVSAASFPAQDGYYPPSPSRDGELLLVSTVDTLFLLDSSLATLASMRNPVPKPVFRIAAMDRLSILEYIPELSVALVANQSCAHVAVLRIASDVRKMQYGLELQALLPPGPLPPYVSPQARVCGLAVKKRTGELGKDQFHVLVTYNSCLTVSYEMSDFPARTDSPVSFDLLL